MTSDYKDSVLAASVANIDLNAPGAIIDGVTMVSGSRFLAMDQTDPSENGIYAWLGENFPARRATDADSPADVTPGMRTTVEAGDVNGNKAFVLLTDNPIVLGVTPLSFGTYEIDVVTAEEAADAAIADLLASNNVWTGTNEFDADVSVVGASLLANYPGDTFNRLEVSYEGQINWGDGASGTDVTLVRSDEGVLTLGYDGTATRAALQIADAPVDGSDLANKDYVDTKGDAVLATEQTFTAKNTFQRISDSDLSLATKVFGDSVNRYEVSAAGKMEWGDGASPTDVTFERGFSGGLRVTADQLQLFDQGGFGFQGITIRATNGSSPSLATVTSADSASRFSMNASGAMQWGDGSTSADVALERNAAGILRVGVAGAATRAAIRVDDAPIAGYEVTNKDYVDNAFNSGSVQQIAVNHTIDLDTEYGFLVNALGTGGLTMTLPGTHTIGKKVLLSDHTGQATPTDFVRLDTVDSDTINGAADYTITTAYGFVEVISNGTNWVIIGSG